MESKRHMKAVELAGGKIADATDVKIDRYEEQNKDEKVGVKQCKGCKFVRHLTTGFYRAGNSYQSLCKTCHNSSRGNYLRSKKLYIKRPTGFAKLSPTVQKEIKLAIQSGTPYLDIAKTHGIPYITLMTWKKRGIPVL